MNTTVANGFNRIAPFYDALANVFFGESIRNSQKAFLNCIPAGARILILGGGTGAWLPFLAEIQPNCEIWFIDISDNMLERARHQAGSSQNITFIHGTQDDLPQNTFDVVITHFFLDLFRAENLPAVIRKIKNNTSPSCQWIVADFVNNGKTWERVLLKIMYTFFQATCDIEASDLPPWGKIMNQSGFQESDSISFFHGFIIARLFLRTASSPAPF